MTFTDGFLFWLGAMVAEVVFIILAIGIPAYVVIKAWKQ